MMQFTDIARQAADASEVPLEEIFALRDTGWAGGVTSRAEAEALFALDAALDERSPAWCGYFAEAIGEYVVNGGEPCGHVSEDTAAWLLARLEWNGPLSSRAGFELLVRVLERAQAAPRALRTYALAQIERGVLTGTGPTRHAGEPAQCVTGPEARLLRRVLFSDSVSGAEVERLFRLKDAVRGARNAAGWKPVFVEAVARHLTSIGAPRQWLESRLRASAPDEYERALLEFAGSRA